MGYPAPVPTLERINVTPVKGLGLHHPDRVDLDDNGIAEDRSLFLVDETGALFGASSFGPLVRVRAEFDPSTDVLTMTFPDGSVVSGEATALGARTTTNFYGRSVDGRQVEGPWAAALSVYVGRTVRLLRCERPGDAIDVHPLTVVSMASVDDLATRGRYEGSLDSRRFRINLELAGCEPYEEDSWDGRLVRIGSATILIQGAIPRCVVTTRSPDTGEKDWDTLTQIAKYRPRIAGGGGLPFGMYADVVSPGPVAMGDPLELL